MNRLIKYKLIVNRNPDAFMENVNNFLKQAKISRDKIVKIYNAMTSITGQHNEMQPYFMANIYYEVDE
jgi:hypothetical protein